MMRHFKRLGLLALGWAFILVGIAGLFLPVIQGILCLLIGLFILSTEYIWAHRLLLKLKQRFPGVARHMDAATAKANEWLHRSPRKPAAKAAAKE